MVSALIINCFDFLSFERVLAGKTRIAVDCTVYIDGASQQNIKAIKRKRKKKLICVLFGKYSSISRLYLDPDIRSGLQCERFLYKTIIHVSGVI